MDPNSQVLVPLRAQSHPTDAPEELACILQALGRSMTIPEGDRMTFMAALVTISQMQMPVPREVSDSQRHVAGTWQRPANEGQPGPDLAPVKRGQCLAVSC